MKKFNFFLACSIVLYFCLAFLIGKAIFRVLEEKDHLYRSEANQILGMLKTAQDLDRFQEKEYQEIKEVTFLSKETVDPSSISLFFTEKNLFSSMIKPWYQEGVFLGYLKFSYVPSYSILPLFFILEGSLLLLELVLLGFFFSIKQRFIKPFYKLESLPYELAKGRFKTEIKVGKNSYLKPFLWGMSQLKDTLEISNKRQLELLKEKQQLLLSLSHDIKTPLNLLKLYEQALEEGLYLEEAEQKRVLKQMKERTVEVETYIETITKSSREELFEFTVENGDFYLKDLLEKVLSIYQEQCQLRKITLTVLPFSNRLLKGDIHRSQEILENIMENAIKYGDGKEIVITFTEEDYCQLIHIFSSGNAVTDNELNHLFDSFYRGGNANGKSGSGLGLYICRELMRKMDGAIYAEKKEEGMMFTLVFR